MSNFQIGQKVFLFDDKEDVVTIIGYENDLKDINGQPLVIISDKDQPQSSISEQFLTLVDQSSR